MKDAPDLIAALARSNCTSLTSLSLRECTRRATLPIRVLQQLTFLDLMHSVCRPEDLSRLTALTELRIGDVALGSLVPLTRLQVLHASRLDFPKSTEWPRLHLPQLRALLVPDSLAEDYGVQLQRFYRFRSLRLLDVSFTRCTAAALRDALAHLPDLEVVDVRRCPLTAADLAALRRDFATVRFRTKQ